MDPEDKKVEESECETPETTRDKIFNLFVEHPERILRLIEEIAEEVAERKYSHLPAIIQALLQHQHGEGGKVLIEVSGSIAMYGATSNRLRGVSSFYNDLQELSKLAWQEDNDRLCQEQCPPESGDSALQKQHRDYR